MNNRIDKGSSDQFFPVRSIADHDDLQVWLSEREFNSINAAEGFADRHGKPMVGLSFATRGSDGKATYSKRGVIWFKDAELRETTLPIIESFISK